MKTTLLPGLLAVSVTLAAPAAFACDADATFILKGPDGSTQLIGSINDFKAMKRAVGAERRYVLWARIDGQEYVVTDPTVIAKARGIFDRSSGFDGQQEALDEQLEALERKQEATDEAFEQEEQTLERKQNALDAEQEKISDGMSRDLDALVREAIQAGKAAKP